MEFAGLSPRITLYSRISTSPKDTACLGCSAPKEDVSDSVDEHSVSEKSRVSSLSSTPTTAASVMVSLFTTLVVMLVFVFDVNVGFNAVIVYQQGFERVLLM